MIQAGAALRRAAGRSWRHGLIAVLGVVGLASLPGSCDRIDEDQSTLCENLIPVLEPAGSLTLLQVSRDTVGGDRLTVRYRVDAAGAAGAEPAPVVRTIACRFSGAGYDEGRRVLTAVDWAEGPLSATRLAILNQQWMKDAEAHKLAQERLRREGAALPRGWVTLDAGQGYFLQLLVNAGPPTALYALLALAYSLVYGLTNRINLAFGEIATVGGYGALISVVLAVMLGLGNLGAAMPLAIGVAIMLSACIGAFAGARVFVPLLGRASQPILVATVGLGIVIQEGLARAQGVRELWLPPILAGPHLIADGPFRVVITTMQAIVAAGAASLVLVLILAMRFSHFGRLWRAVADDRRMAALLGIDTGRVVMVSLAVASAVAGLGGTVLTVYYGGTSFSMGTAIGLKALLAAIVGGIGSLPGAALGGLILGLTEALWSAYQPIVWRDGMVYALAVGFLILRPQGLLGTRRALEEREERP